ncbi:MAG: bifunctional demethylmenaquinone methyltransferase/2-methoxy-6-polyprenyl-1,4-benzoquinol methylase UbiE [Halobacteriovoraceae bacterium]|nr:bifunctional demethylmenaquinone methyltransferase/2-methoxy-6-polyprenyl-1,4-benzoquinol methylase UbiE [Halobacteriovoraceae bacterium]
MGSTTLNSRKKESYKIFNQIAKTYDFLNHFLSFGIDIYWRNQIRKNLPKINELDILDLATGTGDVAITLEKSPRVKSIVGIDMSHGMIEEGLKKIHKKNLENRISLKIGDGVQIPFDAESFDVITLSFGIRNFSSPKESLKNIKRVLKKDGRALIMEFSLPKSKLIKFLYFFYFRKILPYIGNLISNHGDAYTYLNQTVEEFPYGDEFANLMKKAGLKNVRYIPLTFGIATLYIGEK